MQGWVAFDENGAAEDFFEFFEVLIVLGFEDLGDVRMNAQHDVLALESFGDFLRFDEDFAHHSLHAFDIARAFAMRARGAESALEALLDAFAGDGHQAEIVELQNFVRRFVGAHGFFESLHDALAVFALVHIDEVDDDDTAKIAQADLADDFLDGFDVGFDDGVFEAIRFTDEFAGIDINGHQRFGLIDDDVAGPWEGKAAAYRNN